IANILSSVLGRRITHVKCTEEQMVERYAKLGIPESVARMLSAMEARIAQSGEESLTNVVEEVAGKMPMTFKAFAEQNKDVWT
ncbi:MAG: hypothetical protein Q9226_004721, partial [Calogaya cf. arnoldii]